MLSGIWLENIPKRDDRGGGKMAPWPRDVK